MKRKVVVLVIEIILIAILVFAAVNAYNYAFAESDVYFIICNPESHVNARNKPQKAASIVGRLECGDMVRTDGRQKNGYYHIIDCSFEQDEAWISGSYLVQDKPYIGEWHSSIISEGRVAARRNVNGKRLRWLNPGTGITIYVLSNEWCITNRGFIRSEYLGVQR